MSDLRSMGEIAARIGILTIACSRCERRECYRLGKLIARHRADAIVPELIADCPQRESAGECFIIV